MSTPDTDLLFFDCSSAQRRLWFLDQLEPGNPFYNVPAAVRLEGVLDVAALEAALRQLMQRHEVLRTTFRSENGEPVQVVHPELPVQVAREDLSSLPREEAWERAKALARQEALAPFHLDSGPLLRVKLARLGPEEHVLLLTLHHIISDGWSVGVLVREVGALYEAHKQGREARLPELPIQYADYAHWQREWMASEALSDSLAFWKQSLASPLPVLELPTDRPRPPVQTFRGAHLSAQLPGPVLQRLKALGQQEGSTLFMVLLGAFSSLLYRYSHQEDVVVGTPVANRGRVETEGLIGFFVNLLPLRVDLSSNPSFLQLLQRVRQSTLQAFAHQDVPFEKLVEEVQPARDLSRGPFFQSMLVLQNAPTGPLRLPGLQLHLLDWEIGTAKYDLTVLAEEKDGSLNLQLEYNLDLFDAATAQRLLGHFQRLLQAVAEAPSTPLDSLPLLSEAERHQQLVEWNDTHAPFPSDSCFHHLFEQQARLHPYAPAVSDDAAALTYRQLDEETNQLAHELISRGLAPGERVGVCLRRSVGLMKALLAVLKAGGAYVPLEPKLPPARLRALVEEAGCRLVVDAALLEELEAAARTRPTSSPSRPVLAEQLAYVLFTSGSTGRPKGVMVPHSGLTHYLHWAKGAYPAGAGNGAPVHSSIGFDLTITSLFLPLVSGGTVVMVPDEGGVEALAEILRSRRDFGLVKLTPSHLEVLARLIPAEELAGLTRSFIIGGEALSPALVEHWLRHAPATALVNEYGPTETVVGCAIYTAPVGAPPSRSVPIGRPIQNTELYVLDERMRPVPLGVHGELYIGGAGVAWGYLGAPELTAQKFVPHPFSQEPGARLYRTGDRVRYLPDGNLEFLGRIDHQVKIRGHRIELGEIESVLGQHPAVREAAVAVLPDRRGQPRLVAWLSGRTEVQIPTLRAFLQEQLPEYMVPAAFVLLDTLPLNANGKVDRKALPPPAEASLAATQEHEEPRTETERLLAGLWTTVLGVERVGRLDGFFELGGHSLLAAQLASRIRETFRIELPLRKLFEAPTLAEQARHVDSALGTGTAAALAKLTPVPPSPSRQHLSSAQRRLWFLDQLEPGNPFYNVPAAVRLEGVLDVAALEAALRQLVQRHEVLRTTFRAINSGEPVQLVHPEQPVQVAHEDLSSLPREEAWERARALAHQEALAPFRLDSGPLLRVKLARLGPEEHVLLLTMHHIISDGWSVGVLVREVGALYEAHKKGREAQLPPLPIQYADYAHWQREWMASEALSDSLAFWKQSLASPLPVLELPTDRPRPPVQTFRGAHLSAQLPGPVLQRLKALGQQEGSTLFMVLLGAFSSLLYRYSHQEDVVVGTPVANRSRVETEGLIGFFVNLLPLRVDLSSNPSFLQLLQRVRQSTLQAFAHQDVPFERLVEEVQPARDLSRGPLFQSMLVLQNAPTGPLRLPGLQLHLLDWEAGTAKYDLTVLAEEKGDSLNLQLEYNLDLFDAATAQRLLSHFQRLLQAVAEAPSTPLDSLPLLSEAERRQLLVEWNDTRTPFPLDACFHHLFEQRVQLHPDAPAVSDDAVSLTYRQLDERANVLAHQLSSRGVGRDTVVGLYAERGVDLLASILAIFKAGGAYVPIEPAYPARRIRQVLQQARTRFVLHSHACAPSLAAALEGLEPAPEALCIPELLANPTPTGAPSRRGAPKDLAYVIFTSGSTGLPKGAMVEQVGMLNHLFAKVKDLRLGDGDSIVQNASQCFDISVWQLLVCLLVGGRVRIVGDDTARDALRLLETTRTERITVLEMVPSLLRALLQDEACRAEAGRLQHLRWLVLTGEALPPELAREWLRLRPDIPLVNAYGPTECSDDVTHHFLTEPPPAEQLHTPIGKALSNLQLYVLGPAQELLPVGVHGELFVGGVGVGRGYLDDPEKTARAFLPDPFGPTGGRLYRTGDRVRRLADGSIEFLGRIDHQVKVRGYRIELGEIENVLSKHPSVRDVVVVGLPDGRGGQRLVAYCVPEGEVAVPTLRTWLEEQLPEYMVPAAFVLLDALPLSANGKVDRKALPPPEDGGFSTDTPYVTPRTETEQRVASIWSEVLGAERVGALDDFFSLGGHSLLAMRVMSRVRDVLGVELPLKVLFEAPSVERFAARVEAQRQLRAGATADRIVPVAREGALPLSFAQQRLWFFDQLEPGSHVFNMPGAFRLTGPFDAHALEHALQQVVRRHEVLRTTFGNRQGVAELVLHAELPLTLGRVDLRPLPSGEREETLRQLARRESTTPFALTHGPLLRATLVQLGAEEHVLLITLHHIVADGWSISVLVEEVLEVYTATREGRASTLPPLPVQYADYAHWQRSFMEGERLREQLGYWKQKLRGPLPVLELPADLPRPRIQTFEGALVESVLPSGLGESLRELGRREGATLFMTLLAGFKALLHRLTGLEDVVVGTPVAGRDRSEVERLIGCFINTLALRTQVSPELSFRQLVRSVRETSLEAFARQDVPFEKLVEELQVERSLSHTPVFQVLFNMLNLPAGAGERKRVGALELEPFGEGLLLGSKFDLTLYVEERTDGALRLLLVYNTSLFEPRRMEELLAQFQGLLEAGSRRPDAALSEGSLLSEAQRRLLPDPTAPLEPTWAGSIPERFASWVQRQPEQVAVKDSQVAWSYRELDTRSLQLAHGLRAGGVESGDVVAVLGHRSASLVQAMLGVMRAGAAFVILDPAYPTARLEARLRASRPKALIVLEAGGSPSEGLTRCATEAGARLVLTLPGTQWPETSALAPLPTPGPEDLAYLAFTSGSTGEPKALAGTHRPLTHFMQWHVDTHALRPGERVSMLSGLSHDPLLRDVFAPLWAGGTVCIPEPERMGEPGYLLGWLARERIGVAHLTPPMAQLVCSGPATVQLPELRAAFFGGDTLRRQVVEELRARAPDVCCVNFYGTTETPQAMSAWRVEPGAPVEQETLPIGHGIEGVQLLVLTPSGGLAGLGELGEIHVRTPYLTRGYVGDAALSQERFRTNPFTGASGDRLYRTGDRGRYRADGSVEYLGRIDGQVKVRGFRVELGEIASTLERHPAVARAVLSTHEDGRGERALCAYVKYRDGLEKQPSREELREHLAGLLPDYMVPAAFVVLDTVPLTPNGKVDLRALPPPQVGAPTPEEEFVAPSTPTEEAIAAIWSEVLGVGPLSVNRSFFEVGGHSLAATQVVSRLRSTFELELPLNTLFQAKTIAGLATAIEDAITAEINALSDEEAEALAAASDDT